MVTNVEKDRSAYIFSAIQNYAYINALNDHKTSNQMKIKSKGEHMDSERHWAETEWIHDERGIAILIFTVYY